MTLAHNHGRRNKGKKPRAKGRSHTTCGNKENALVRRQRAGVTKNHAAWLADDPD
jgi:hypothetical protein